MCIALAEDASAGGSQRPHLQLPGGCVALDSGHPHSQVHTHSSARMAQKQEPPPLPPPLRPGVGHKHGQTRAELLSPGLCTCLPPYTSVAPSFAPVSQYCSSFSRWALWFWGPWSVDLSSGSPIFIFLISSTCIVRSPQRAGAVSHHSGSR